MKKAILLAISIIYIFTLSSCKEKGNNENIDRMQHNGEMIVEPKVEEDFIPDEDEEEVVIPQGIINKLVVNVNNVTFKIGDKFDDINELLGTEVKSSQVNTQNIENDVVQMTTHYFEGIAIDVSEDGIINKVVVSGNYPDSNQTVAGIKLGDTPEVVRSNLEGVYPDYYSKESINYTIDTVAIIVGLDADGTGNVNYICMCNSSLS